MMPIAIDAMGGDFYPRNPVSGAVQAVKENDLHVVIVGQESVIRKELSRHRFNSRRVDIVNATEVVTMDDPVVTVLRNKTDSSLRVCFDLHKRGDVDGIVSAGNSGAMLAIGRHFLKTIPGIDRPCISALLPSKRDKVLLIDAGANIDCSSANLLQFAILGSLYMQEIHGVKDPRIGLLNIGTEEGKGDDIRRNTYQRLKSSSLNFVGNLEGREFFEGEIDVVVTDGFAGNVLLKSVQGAADFVKDIILNEIERSIPAKIGSLLMRPVFSQLRKRTDYAEFGGAPLLGLKGNAIVCHGASNPRALAFGIKFASWAEQNNLLAKIEDKINEYEEIF